MSREDIQALREALDELRNSFVAVRTTLGWVLKACSAGGVLLAASVFWQAPSIRQEVVREIARLEKADEKIQGQMSNLEYRLTCLETRKK